MLKIGLETRKTAKKIQEFEIFMPNGAFTTLL